MKKTLGIVLLFGVVAILQGCMKIETTANINEIGETNMTMRIDMSQMALLDESMQGGEIEDFCTENEMSENIDKNYENVICKKIDEYVSEISYTTDMAQYIKQSTSSASEYMINIQTLVNNSQDSLDQESFQSNVEMETENSLDMAKMMGFVMTLTINFSGDILSSDIGTVQGNTLNIDILAEGDKIEKLNEIWVKVKKNNRDILTAEEEQKIKYQKTAEFFGKRLAKLKGEATLKRIDSLLSILEEDTLKKLLNLFQKAKAKTYANRYLEAKIWLQLNN